MIEYTNSQIEKLIDEHIHNKRNRLILKLHFIDGESYDVIASHENIEITPRQIARVISKEAAVLAKYLCGSS